jgi:predicted ArsR family transcriptional regulator
LIILLYTGLDVFFEVMERWSNRFLSSTRGQVVELLRRGEATVNELAKALSLTDNAVRSHLSTLERDGLVRQSGKRTATRKPEALYSLTPEAGQLFPKAYDLLFNQLLHSLESRITPAEKAKLLREVGRRLAAGVRTPLSKVPTEAELRERLKIAVGVLKDLGGLAELEDADDEIVIRGFSCPLASAVSEHPEVCQLAETLLAEIIGVPVREECVRNGAPRCLFKLNR